MHIFSFRELQIHHNYAHDPVMSLMDESASLVSCENFVNCYETEEAALFAINDDPELKAYFVKNCFRIDTWTCLVESTINEEDESEDFVSVRVVRPFYGEEDDDEGTLCLQSSNLINAAHLIPYRMSRLESVLQHFKDLQPDSADLESQARITLLENLWDTLHPIEGEFSAEQGLKLLRTLQLAEEWWNESFVFPAQVFLLEKQSAEESEYQLEQSAEEKSVDNLSTQNSKTFYFFKQSGVLTEQSDALAEASEEDLSASDKENEKGSSSTQLGDYT